MNALHLLWIIPLVFVIGCGVGFLGCLILNAEEFYDYYLDEEERYFD